MEASITKNLLFSPHDKNTRKQLNSSVFWPTSHFSNEIITQEVQMERNEKRKIKELKIIR